MKTINQLLDQTIAEYSKEVGRLMGIIKTLQGFRHELPPGAGAGVEVGVDTFTRDGHVDAIAQDPLVQEPLKIFRREELKANITCRTAAGAAIMEAIQKFKPGETLCIEEFARDQKISVKRASNFIFRAAKKGVLKKAGKRGFWQRVWPGHPHVPAPVEPPAAPPGKPDFKINRRATKASLEQHLKDACQERDRYREAGNDKLEEIAQRKVDDLSKRLEACDA